MQADMQIDKQGANPGSTIHVAIRLFDEVQRKRVEQLFRLNKKNLVGNWELSGAAEADVVIFDPLEPGGDLLLKSSMSSKQKIPVVYSVSNNTDCPWYIEQGGNYDRCISVLNDIAGLLCKKSGTAKAGQTDTSAYSSVELVMHAVLYKEQSAFYYKDLLGIYIDGDRNRVVIVTPKASSGVTLEKVAKLLGTVKPDNLRVEKSSAAAISQAERHESALQIRLDAFCWGVMNIAGNHRLLPDVRLDVFKLRQWPDFTQCNHSYNQIVLAAFLKRFAAGYDTILHKTGVAEEELIALINACHVTGLLHDGNSVGVATEKNMKPKVEKSLMKKILGSLFGNNKGD